MSVLDASYTAPDADGTAFRAALVDVIAGEKRCAWQDGFLRGLLAGAAVVAFLAVTLWGAW